jgi:hypothetical protein
MSRTSLFHQVLSPKVCGYFTKYKLKLKGGNNLDLLPKWQLQYHLKVKGLKTFQLKGV